MRRGERSVVVHFLLLDGMASIHNNKCRVQKWVEAVCIYIHDATSLLFNQNRTKYFRSDSLVYQKGAVYPQS